MNNTRFGGKYLHVRQVLNSVTLAAHRSRYDENCNFKRQVYLRVSLISGGCLPTPPIYMNRAIRGAYTRRMWVSRNWLNTTRVRLPTIAALQLLLTVVESNCLSFYFLFKEPTVDNDGEKKNGNTRGFFLPSVNARFAVMVKVTFDELFCKERIQ